MAPFFGFIQTSLSWHYDSQPPPLRLHHPRCALAWWFVSPWSWWLEPSLSRRWASSLDDYSVEMMRCTEKFHANMIFAQFVYIYIYNDYSIIYIYNDTFHDYIYINVLYINVLYINIWLTFTHSLDHGFEPIPICSNAAHQVSLTSRAKTWRVEFSESTCWTGSSLTNLPTVTYGWVFFTPTNYMNFQNCGGGLLSDWKFRLSCSKLELSLVQHLGSSVQKCHKEHQNHHLQKHPFHQPHQFQHQKQQFQHRQRPKGWFLPSSVLFHCSSPTKHDTGNENSRCSGGSDFCRELKLDGKKFRGFSNVVLMWRIFVWGDTATSGGWAEIMPFLRAYSKGTLDDFWFLAGFHGIKNRPESKYEAGGSNIEGLIARAFGQGLSINDSRTSLLILQDSLRIQSSCREPGWLPLGVQKRTVYF